MNDKTELTIEDTVSKDVGDETAKRFRYQWSYAAIICCALLDASSEFAEVFCEHHEDILVRLVDRSYIGIQVKTRAIDQPLWRPNDEEIVNSFSRFAHLDSQFPNQFREFRFVTNHPAQATSNGQDVKYLLKNISEADNLESLLGITKAFIRRIAGHANLSEALVYSSLKKTHVIDDLPQLRDITSRLIQTIVATWDGAAIRSYTNIQNAATQLVASCFRAASLASQDLIPLYFSLSEVCLQQSELDQIHAKSFDKQRVESILVNVLEENFPLISELLGSGEINSCNRERLHEKLTAGGFSAISTSYAGDLCDTADYAGIKLVQKFGKEVGLQKYHELRLKVHGDSASAFEEAKKPEDPFGAEMLSILRIKLKQKVESKEPLYGYTCDHLEGLAYSLTSQCKVVWSNRRPWEEK